MIWNYRKRMQCALICFLYTEKAELTATLVKATSFKPLTWELLGSSSREVTGWYVACFLLASPGLVSTFPFVDCITGYFFSGIHFDLAIKMYQGGWEENEAGYLFPSFLYVRQHMKWNSLSKALTTSRPSLPSLQLTASPTECRLPFLLQP